MSVSIYFEHGKLTKLYIFKMPIPHKVGKEVTHLAELGFSLNDNQTKD